MHAAVPSPFWASGPTDARVSECVRASRLDLVPINRSVGLKAKPTKPVTEVLRPVVAKYGLDLGSLLVRLVSGSPLACM